MRIRNLTVMLSIELRFATTEVKKPGAPERPAGDPPAEVRGRPGPRRPVDSPPLESARQQRARSLRQGRRSPQRAALVHLTRHEPTSPRFATGHWPARRRPARARRPRASRSAKVSCLSRRESAVDWLRMTAVGELHTRLNWRGPVNAMAGAGGSANRRPLGSRP